MTTGTGRRPVPGTLGVALTVLVAAVGFAVLAPLHWSDPAGQDLSLALTPPSLGEPLGLDHLGRSVTARLASAMRLTGALAVGAVLLAAAVGTAMGVLSAMHRGAVDVAMRSCFDALAAIPLLLIVLLAAALANGGTWPLYIGVAVAMTIEYFRVARARAAVLLAGNAVQAARLMDLGSWHVLRRHLAPDLLPVIAVMAIAGLGTVVLAVSTLGFIGLGVSPPTAELGAMITESFPYYYEAPWMVIAPVSVLLLVLGSLLALQSRRSSPRPAIAQVDQ